ncbi:hypothetical protein BCR35DRAFT_354773 [Leucosporidium creatinivorum]|uniref:Homeobox domain-containing protein n=1 Tax=Leucosporidium creatinivorum TaxID=106004 RepID=A0A1Y2E8R8_9BASI|nr:hypothetical protein BCR35DRAFT_354773 [Leucosporidium creatinivorum]
MTSHAFYNNVAPFPSRQRPTPGSSSSHPFPQPPLRSLPTFGSPNEYPNPPTHYFPSKAGAYNRRQRSSSLEEEGAQAGEERRAPGPFPGAGGGKMRRDDRTTWDAGSELMRVEREEGPAEEASPPGDEMETDDKEETDATSVRSKDAESIKDSASGKDVAKKRSRTLTTAHQTAVLNALLAKTRFPSTETREEVGQQIGMSARRVQIWFQNRRQSQKRARDREASEVGAAPTSHHYDYQQRSDPYARYPPPPAHSSASSSSTVRPDLSRQTSMDSLASRSSFASARSSHSSFSQHRAPRDTLSPLSDVAPRWPGAPSYGSGWQQHHQPPQQVTSPGPGEAGSRGSLYFPPPPMPTARQGSIDMETSRPRSSSTTADGSVKLPSLSAVLGGALPGPTEGYNASQPPPRQVVFSHSQPFSPQASNASRPPPPAPSSGTRAFTNARSILSPPSPPLPGNGNNSSVSSRPFDDGFSRLRISSEGPLSPQTRQASPPDILDAAMETVYRPTNVNPPRSSLPPLRLGGQGGSRTSEADAALLAPILPPINLSSTAEKSKHTLPPISSLALSSPSQRFPSRASTWSQQSAQSATSSAGGHTRSSVSSFDTLGTGWGGGPTSHASSRTSFSSEVQEEWERMSQAGVIGNGTGGRKVKTEVGPWDHRGEAGRSVAGSTMATPVAVSTSADVRMEG